jgi:hypothetical protein
MINADIDHVSRQRPLHFAEIDAAVDTVRQFLVRFSGSSSQSGSSKQTGA